MSQKPVQRLSKQQAMASQRPTATPKIRVNPVAVTEQPTSANRTRISVPEMAERQ
jgi:hypothetical protein